MLFSDMRRNRVKVEFRDRHSTLSAFYLVRTSLSVTGATRWSAAIKFRGRRCTLVVVR